MAGRRWADAKTGGPATGIDGPVGLDVGVIEVERGLGRRKRRVGSVTRRCDRRKCEVGGSRVGQATVGALSGVRGARVIACSGRVGQRANAGPGCVDADAGRQWWAEARTGRSGRGQRRVQSCASEPVVDPEVRRMLEQQARNVKVTVLLSNMNSEICVPEVVVAGSPSGCATSVPELAFKNIEMLFEEPEKSAPVKSKR